MRSYIQYASTFMDSLQVPCIYHQRPLIRFCTWNSDTESCNEGTVNLHLFKLVKPWVCSDNLKVWTTEAHLNTELFKNAF